MAGTCTMSGDGWSFFPTITTASIPIIGAFL
jgi:hypothetical protein